MGNEQMKKANQFRKKYRSREKTLR